MKNRPKRSAVSAVMNLFPCTISFIRLGGTLIFLANRYWLIPMGSEKFIHENFARMDRRKLSAFHMILIMIICDFNIIHIAIAPFETYPPLVVDSYAVLAFPVAFQNLKLIARRKWSAAEGSHQARATKGSGSGIATGRSYPDIIFVNYLKLNSI